MNELENIPQAHLTHSVVMVCPLDFAFNEQTGLDNEFQHQPTVSEQGSVSRKVMDEFESSIQVLQSLNIETLILGKQHTDKRLPDAVFPNNWFSTRANGQIVVYPMKTENRQNEVQVPQLKALVNAAGYEVSEVVDLRAQFPDGTALEGTGSLIFHHPTNQLFAAISERCQLQALITYAENFGYQLVKFNTTSTRGTPIYHTNVLMSCGVNFAVITEPVINGEDKKHVMQKLSDCVDDIIIISEAQMSLNFCGNILQLKDNDEQPVIAFSQSAYNGFTPAQRKTLERHGSLAICEIPTIERIGGGSTRCMLAENFLIR